MPPILFPRLLKYILSISHLEYGLPASTLTPGHSHPPFCCRHNVNSLWPCQNSASCASTVINNYEENTTNLFWHSRPIRFISLPILTSDPSTHWTLYNPLTLLSLFISSPHQCLTFNKHSKSICWVNEWIKILFW